MDKGLKIFLWVLAIITVVAIIFWLVNKNRNGKTTITKINADGTKTTTTTFADGSVNVATYNRNGEVIGVQRGNTQWVVTGGPGGIGKSLIHCCTKRDANCACTSSSWVAHGDCNDPGCPGGSIGRIGSVGVRPVK